MELLPTVYLVISQRWNTEYVEALFRNFLDAKEFKEEREEKLQHVYFRIDERKLR